MSEFPDEWTNPCGGDSQCRSPIIEPTWQQISQYNHTFFKWWSWCMFNPQSCKIARGYCKMQTNPAYTTTYPNGNVSLIEFGTTWGTSSPLFLWTWMTQLPYFPNKRFGYSINERRWNQRDCCSAGKHLQSAGQTHGWNNSPVWMNHHNGNLWPLVSNAAGNTWQFQYAHRPSFWSSPGNPSIYGKTMVVYEHPDDYGFGGTWDSEEFGSTGPRLACCQIKRFIVDWEQAEDSSVRGRGLAEELDDVDVFTVDQYRELFGQEPEKLPGDTGFFDQN